MPPSEVSSETLERENTRQTPAMLATLGVS